MLLRRLTLVHVLLLVVFYACASWCCIHLFARFGLRGLTAGIAASVLVGTYMVRLLFLAIAVFSSARMLDGSIDREHPQKGRDDGNG